MDGLMRDLHILIVDDDDDDAFLTREYLQDSGVLGRGSRIEHESRYAEARVLLESGGYDACILDYRLGGQTGLELLTALRDRGSRLPVILLTGQGDEETAVAALKAGATDYLRKVGLTPELLGSAVRHAIEMEKKERERREAVEALHQEKEFIAAILQNSYDGIAVVTAGGEFAFFSPGMERLFGYTVEEIPTIETWARRVSASAEDETDVLLLWKRDTSQQPPRERVYRFVHRNGRERWCRLQISPMPGGGVVMNGQDITDHKRAEERIQYMALHDPLTNLPTRRLLSDRIEQAVVRAKRNDHKVAILYLDLDKFKQINDTWGHETGDAVLVSTATALRSIMRQSDTVARLGGDEFVVVLPELTRADQARMVAWKIIEKLNHVEAGKTRKLSLGVSVGIAYYPDDGEAAETLVSQADAAMYEAKREGGGSFREAEGRAALKSRANVS